MHIESLSLKTTSKGARVWLNNKTFSNCGFVTGVTFDVKHYDDDNRVELIIDPDGKRSVAKGDIVDLQNHKMSSTLQGADRVHVKYLHGRVIISAYHHDEKVKRRITSLKEKTSRKIPLKLAEICIGVGLLGKKLCQGLLAAGISTSLAFAVDYDRHAMDIVANYQYVDSNAVLLQDNLFTMNKALIPEVDIMFIGYPCVGFSKQQSKVRCRDIYHPEAGLLFVPILEAISRGNPALIVIENSDMMLDSDTDFIISGVLEKTDYLCTDVTLSGRDFGDFEDRKRVAKVFYSKGLSPLDLKQLVANIPNNRTVADLVEPIADNARDWKSFDYLKAKNNQKNHRHSFIVASNDDKKLPTFGAWYGKMQCDSAFLPHPENPNLHRPFRTGEHCNVREITGKVKEGIVAIADGTHHLQKGRTNALKAHHLLGNSISPTPWFYTGNFIGEWLTGQFTIQSKSDSRQMEIFA